MGSGEVSYEYLRKLFAPEYERRILERERESLECRYNLDRASSRFKKFRYWEMLPTEIRCMIAKETDFATRFSLMFTSKTNYEIARSVPMRIKSIAVNDPLMCEHPAVVSSKKKYIYIDLKSEFGDVTTVYFVKEGKATRVHRYWKMSEYQYGLKTMLLKKRDYIEESVSFVEKLLAMTDYRVDEFHADNWGKGGTFFDKLQVLNKLEVYFSDGDSITRWMDTASRPLDHLSIRCSDLEYVEFPFDHETINNTKDLHFSIDNSLDDFSYFNLHCEKFVISSPDNSAELINQFVKKWINGDIWDNFLFGRFVNTENFFTRRAGRFDESVILRDIDCFEWDDQFKRENEEVVDMIGSLLALACYYIESKKGLGATLAIGTRGVTLVVTGKRRSRKRRASRDN